MKLVVSLLLLWVTAAEHRVIKGNDNPKLSSQMKQKFASPFHVPRTVDVRTRANCVQDYSPCRCDSYPNIYIDCDYVTAETVRDVFQRVNGSEIYELLLNLLPSDDTNIVSLPADLLGDTSVTRRIGIEDGNNFPFNIYTNLVIDPLAFRASRNSLTELWFCCWDFELQKDFSFLNGFNKLEKLLMLDPKNVTSFQYLPPLPSLRYLRLTHCTGLINFPDLSPAKLEVLLADFCSITDETADEIVAKLIDTSTDSLLDLSLYDNSLTRIPNQLGSPFAFPKLETLNLEFNAIKAIENGTFQGNFSSLRYVLLASNELAVFEEGVYKELLAHMLLTTDGTLFVGSNAFACGCDIAWLVRDNRNFLPVIYDGRCGIDTEFPDVRFDDLNPESFANCPI